MNIEFKLDARISIDVINFNGPNKAFDTAAVKPRQTVTEKFHVTESIA